MSSNAVTITYALFDNLSSFLVLPTVYYKLGEMGKNAVCIILCIILWNDLS